MSFRDPIEWEATLPVRPSSPAWRATLKAFYGSPLTADERALFVELTGRQPADVDTTELLAVVGRRGGKSETIARVACFEALHGGHAVALAPGQRGLIAVISPLREQSGEIIRYVKGLAGLRPLKRSVTGETASSVDFGPITVATMTADAVNVSGPTVVCAIRDELAKFPGDGSAMPDREIDNSLRPALAPVIGAPPRRLIGITSAYISEGLAFETDRGHFGRQGAPVLVVRGPTATFNPNIDRAWLERERARVGEVVFRREYLAEWQDAITDGYFPLEAIEACTAEWDRLPPSPKLVQECSYSLAIDPAFRGDRYAWAVAHRELRRGAPPRVVVDACGFLQGSKARPLSPEHAAEETAAELLAYGTAASSDQFAFDALRELYARKGLVLQLEAWTAQTKPPRFRSFRDALVDGLVLLPNVPALRRELASIQSKLLQQGGERIQARSGHDDLAHAVVMAATNAMALHPQLTDFPVERPPRTRRRGMFDGGPTFTPSKQSTGGVLERWWERAEQHNRSRTQ